MNKVVKVLLILVVIGLVCGFGVYMYVFHKPHRNIAKETPAFALTSAEILKQFSEREDSCNKVYGDKTIQITGKIADISKKDNIVLTIVLDNTTTGVSCSFDSAYSVENSAVISKFQTGNDITLKGKCDGYDAIMGVVLTRCALVEK